MFNDPKKFDENGRKNSTNFAKFCLPYIVCFYEKICKSIGKKNTFLKFHFETKKRMNE